MTIIDIKVTAKLPKKAIKTTKFLIIIWITDFIYYISDNYYRKIYILKFSWYFY